MADFIRRIRGAPDAAREYACESHGPFEIVVDLATSHVPKPCPACGQLSERTLNANIVTRIDPLGFVRGKSDPPPNPLAMDTRPLAEGMPMNEWRAKNRRKWRDHDRRVAKSKGAF